MNTAGKLLVIDLMPILYRGYFVFLSKPRRTANGINTSSLSLLASTIEQMLRTLNPTHLAIALESTTPTFRHIAYPPYKAQREKMPEDIAAAIQQAYELAEAWGIATVQKDGYEADDILGTLATRGVQDGFEVIVASPDKDLGQLAEEQVYIFKPGDPHPLSASEIAQQWKLASPKQMIDYLALAGDSSDNIPGVPGIGPKTAISLLETYGSIDNILAHANEVSGRAGIALQNHLNDARMSKKLVTIVRDVPLDYSWDDLKRKPINTSALGAVLRKYELNTIAKRLGVAIDATPMYEEGDLFTGQTDTQDVHTKPSTYQTLNDYPHTYTLIQTTEECLALAETLSKETLIAIDTETTGLDPHHDRAVGCSFAIDNGRAWYVALPEDPAEHHSFLRPLIPILESETIAKVGHNLKFDRAVFKQIGIDVKGPLHDTLLEHYLLDATDRHNMDHVANCILNYAPIAISTLIGDGKSTHMGMLSPETILDYAAEDADVTYRLHKVLTQRLAEMGLMSLLQTCEEPLASVLLRMEDIGIRLDPSALRYFRSELEGEILRLELAVRDYTGAGINLASPKQVGEFLFGHLALDPTVKRTTRGQYPTNEELLLKLRDRHPVVDLLLDWRACMKLKNTYVDKLPTHIDPEDGRIHTTFNQALTDTGRLSSSDPNLQNIPIRSERGQRIREAFVARAPGWKILSADYSQVELRIMASMSGDRRMIDAFSRGEDIHAQTASVVYNIPLEEVTARQRSYCKMVNFGIIYGISAFGLASRLRIPRKEAQQLIDTYFQQYPTVKAFMEQSIASARKTGYAQTLFGRRRALPDITSRNGSTRNAAERIAINMPIQGTAADIIKLAMVKIDRELQARNLRAQMTLQIHDELLFDVPEEELDEVQAIVRTAMETVVQLNVPLQVSIGIGDNWLAAH